MKKIVLFVITSILFTVVLLSVKNSYSAFIKNVQTSLEVTTPKLEAIFLPGTEFSGKIKQTAGNSNSTNETTNTNITSIVRSNVLTITPTVNNIVSTSDSSFPIYAWFSNGVIYYYTEVEHPKTNSYARNMFRGLTNLTSIDISTLDTSLTTDFDGMFFEDSSITTLDLSNFDTSNAEYMGGMFYKCNSLTSLNVSSFDTSNVLEIHLMFYKLQQLENLDISNFELKNVTGANSMLSSMTKLKEFKTPKNYPNDASVVITLPKTMYDQNMVGYSSLGKSTNPVSPTETIIKEGYLVTLDSQGGTGGSSSVVAFYDAPLSSINIPTKSGYQFLEYNTDINSKALNYSKEGFDGRTIRVVLTNNEWNFSNLDLNRHVNAVLELSILPKDIEFNDVPLESSQYIIEQKNSKYYVYIDFDINNEMLTIRNGYHYDTLYRFIDFEYESSDYDFNSLTVDYVVLDGKRYYDRNGNAVGYNDIKSNITLYAKYGTLLTNSRKNYDYIGDIQEFIVPSTGIYRIELWGSGGTVNDLIIAPGKGGYTKGEISLTEGDRIYVQVGSGSYNGSGSGEAPGGGATDIRLTSGTWDNFDSLKSRIMVAAGGGGGFHKPNTSNHVSGDAGGLIGYDADAIYTGSSTLSTGYSGHGATQTQGGSGGTASLHPGIYTDGGTFVNAHKNGTFGQGGYGGASSGGGGGYYGGGHGIHPGSTWTGGGGGSSFISGYAGCDAISSSSTENNIVHTNSPYHYSGKKFTNSVMIDGRGCDWSSGSAGNCGANQIQPDGSYATGHSGNGYARITLITQGEIWNYAYNGNDGTDGSVQTFKAPVKGTYKLETWGAQGGTNTGTSISHGGYGGYSTGNINLNTGELLYITVGGGFTTVSTCASNGADGVNCIGGYNGGGSGQFSGGGATSITTTNRGELYNFDNYRNEIVMVSGGGGGDDAIGYAGSGGGYIGGSSSSPEQVSTNNPDYLAAGGTQSMGGDGYESGTFGKGGGFAIYAQDHTDLGGAGGGGYYGGGSGRHPAWSSGGGGSGYLKSTLSNKAMYCYNCVEELTNANTFTISTTGSNKDTTNCPNGYSSSPISKCAKAGNGYARLTLVNVD